ncbi:MAG TPA: hypothetical protein VF483_09150, partial [Gemmatimonadaceae bacterium]
MIKRVLVATIVLGLMGSRAGAQEPAPAAASTAVTERPEAAMVKPIGPADVLMPHLADSKLLEYPCLRGWSDRRGPEGDVEAAWGCEMKLPVWKVAGIDFGPTKHTVWLFLAAAVVAVVLIRSAVAHRKHSDVHGHPKGAAAAVEAI